MPDLTTINVWISHLAVVVLLAAALGEAVRTCRQEPRRFAVALRVVVPVMGLAAVVRCWAPWGPHTSSGRDLLYLDAVIEGPATAHTHLMAALLAPVRWAGDSVAAFELGQIGIGSAGAGLVGLLAYGLTRRPTPATLSGLLAALLVALARVDSSSSAMGPLRLVFLLSLLLGLSLVRTGSRLSHLGVAAGLIAVAYGRLEGLLYALLLLVWLVASMAMSPDDDAGSGRSGRGTLGLGALLMLTMAAALLHRGLLVAMVVVVLAWLWRQRGRWPVPRGLMTVAGATAIALLPRLLEVAQLDRETGERLPANLLFVFGKNNILLADAALCTPLVLLLVVVGLAAAARQRGAMLVYAACIALPVWSFTLLFMGNGSARMKLQGFGIVLLLPLAAAGAAWLVPRLHRRWRTGRLSWPALGAVVIGSATLLGWPALRAETSLEQEYRFWRQPSGSWVGDGPVVALGRDETKSRLQIPHVLQRRAGVRIRTIDAPGLPQLRPGDRVWLGADCRRYREGETLPEIARTLTESTLRNESESPAWTIARMLWDLDGTLLEQFDTLAVGERPECVQLRHHYRLAPESVVTVRRSAQDAHFMPPTLDVGIYRVGNSAP
ncbi:MAG: hypothetical protein JRI23_32725 [Deltaproteobacteria bacterium]|nr:hypothetical protein [Deltaproteobacteria bacterium]MBW2537017.1 hypothetical protein [Deltaproteobacteria bacterium]